MPFANATDTSPAVTMFQLTYNCPEEEGLALASDSQLDLIRTPYVLYGVKYIDLVPLAPFPGRQTPRGDPASDQAEMQQLARPCARDACKDGPE